MKKEEQNIRSKNRKQSKIVNPNEKPKEDSKIQVKSGEQISLLKRSIERVLENSITTIVMTTITLYALFGDDIRVLVTDKDGDEIFWILNSIAMALFVIEIILSSICKTGYFLGFFFWLDVLSTASLILDIGWISNEIFGSSTASGAKSALALARAGRASRVGTRAGRIVRIVRLIRLVKLYKTSVAILEQEAEKMAHEQDDQDHGKRHDDSPEKDHELSSPHSKKKPALEHKNTVGQNQGVSSFQNVNAQQNGEAGKPNKHSRSIEQMINQQGGAVGGNGISNNHLNGENGGQGSAGNRDSENFLSDGLGPKKTGQKLPPINISKDYEQGPSKPQILDKYKNDPLIHVSGHQRSSSRERGNDQSQSNKDRPFSGTKGAENHNDEGEDHGHGNAKGKKGKARAQIQKLKENQNQPKEKLDLPQETKLGQKLSDLTTRRVITLVLSIMFSIPIFSSDTYSDSLKSYEIGIQGVYYWQNISELTYFNASFYNYIQYHKYIRAPVIKIEYLQSLNVDSCCNIWPQSYDDVDVPDSDNMRTTDAVVLSVTRGSQEYGYVVVDYTTDNKLNAILSIIRTIFVSILLGGASMLFSKDVEDIVLQPLESMLSKVKRISINPLEAAQIEDQETLILGEIMKTGNLKAIKQKQEQEKMETTILEKLIVKIGALLALGFGEAGSQIIAENMRKGGAVDPLIEGKKIMAIFGFCIINNFADTTEVLQKDIMLFVNEIAEVVHGTIDSFCGQTNKNIGEAFLLVWRYDKDDYTRNESGVLSLKQDQRIKQASDLSVVCFVKCLSNLTVSKKLHRYALHPGLNSRINNYQVKVGFGLHMGWGIEGAIGSLFKIDASYLSPNVNMAARLEAATKQFGTSLLISGVLYEFLTPKCQSNLRKIDIVTVKGSIQPMALYTCDLSFDTLKEKIPYHDKFDTSDMPNVKKKRIKVINRIRRDKRRKEIETGKIQIADQFEKDKEIALMRSIFTKEFYQTWNEGFVLYIAGKWSEALQFFLKTEKMIPKHKDGPSKTLIEVIKNHGEKAPATWKGFRPLTEK